MAVQGSSDLGPGSLLPSSTSSTLDVSCCGSVHGSGDSARARVLRSRGCRSEPGADTEGRDGSLRRQAIMMKTAGELALPILTVTGLNHARLAAQ
jgi:hypothetical protein